MKLRRKTLSLPLLLVLLVTLGSAHVSNVYACEMMGAGMSMDMAEHCCEEGHCFDADDLLLPDFVNDSCCQVSLEMEPHPSMEGTQSLQKRAVAISSDVDPPVLFLPTLTDESSLVVLAHQHTLPIILAPRASHLAVYQRTQRLRI